MPDVAEAEAVGNVEGNMCGTAMRGAVALPGSETTSRRKGKGRPRRRRRVWREGGRSWGRQAATHAPDPVPDKACHRSGELAGRGCKGRTGPEPRSRLTCDRSPVRESRTPGSVGEVPGNRHLYPTPESCR